MIPEEKKRLETMRLARQAQIEDVRQLAEQPAGKRWFARLAQQAFVFETTMDGKNSLLNEGQRILAMNCLTELALANRTLCAEIFTELLIRREQEEISK